MRRAGLFALLVASVAAALVLGACAPGPSATPTSSTNQPVSTPGATAPATAAPTSAGLPGQIDTPWGRAWDGVPASFPSIPGADPTELLDEPVSAAFDLPAEAGTPADVARTFVDALGAAGWAVTVDGPLEDGRFVVDAARGGTLCVARVQARLLGDFVLLTILYGASCPFE